MLLSIFLFAAPDSYGIHWATLYTISTVHAVHFCGPCFREAGPAAGIAIVARGGFEVPDQREPVEEFQQTTGRAQVSTPEMRNDHGKSDAT